MLNLHPSSDDHKSGYDTSSETSLATLNRCETVKNDKQYQDVSVNSLRHKNFRVARQRKIEGRKDKI